MFFGKTWFGVVYEEEEEEERKYIIVIIIFIIIIIIIIIIAIVIIIIIILPEVDMIPQVVLLLRPIITIIMSGRSGLVLCGQKCALKSNKIKTLNADKKPLE